MGDLNSKQGRILGMEPAGKEQVIRAHVPLAEMYKYAVISNQSLRERTLP